MGSVHHIAFAVEDRAAQLAVFADEHGIKLLTGPAGSATWFDCNAMHGSGDNITPYPRSNLFVVFNAASNALGEPFGLEPGTLVTGKMAAALRRMGFDATFDTNFTADLTILEEGYELLGRLAAGALALCGGRIADGVERAAAALDALARSLVQAMTDMLMQGSSPLALARAWLADPVQRYARSVLLIGKDAGQIAAALQHTGVPITHASSLEQAVELAAGQAQQGDAVLLSPACASLDMYRDYAERAEVFRAAVRELALAEGTELEVLS